MFEELEITEEMLADAHGTGYSAEVCNPAPECLRREMDAQPNRQVQIARWNLWRALPPNGENLDNSDIVHAIASQVAVKAA